MKVNTNYEDKDALESDEPAILKQPHFRSHLLDNVIEEPAEADEQDFTSKTPNVAAIIYRGLTVGAFIWLLVACTHFGATLLFFKEGSAISDGYQIHQYKGSNVYVDYHYAVGGRVYAHSDFAGSTNINSLTEKYARGRTVPVFYNPLVPADSVLNRGSDWVSCYLPFAFLLVLFVSTHGNHVACSK